MKGRVAELVYAEIELVQITNTKTNPETVRHIAENLSWEEFKALPAWWNGKEFVLTDGNHRTLAAKWRGERFVPLVLLTKEEFDYVKFSKRSVDLMVHTPESPLVYVKKK